MFGCFQYWLARSLLTILFALELVMSAPCRAVEFGLGTGIALGAVSPGARPVFRSEFRGIAFVDFAEKHRIEVMGVVYGFPRTTRKYGVQYLREVITFGPAWTFSAGLGLQTWVAYFDETTAVTRDPTLAYVPFDVGSYGLSASTHARFAAPSGLTLNFGFEAFYGLWGLAQPLTQEHPYDADGNRVRGLPRNDDVNSRFEHTWAIFVTVAVELSTAARKTK